MAKTPFFRVAVEGATVDGREITRAMIQQMADSYDPATYTARINCEHLRGYSPEGPFNSWGSVTAVKAEQIDLSIGGKTEKRLALFAQFDVTDDARRYNQAGQKLFSSIEVHPDFVKTGKAYLMGLAFTDSPASLGTEVLKFSRDDKRKDNLVQLGEIELAYEAEESGAAEAATGAFASMKRFFDSFGKQPEPVQPAVSPAGKEPADPVAAFAQFAGQFGAQMETLNAGLTKSFTAIETRMAKMAEDHEALRKSVETTPSRTYTSRPPASGGTGAVRAEC